MGKIDVVVYGGVNIGMGSGCSCGCANCGGVKNVEAEYEAAELTEAVNRFLSGLSYDDRFIFVRRYWYADPVGDIAKMKHERPDRISMRLFRLREKLRITLKKEGLLV